MKNQTKTQPDGTAYDLEPSVPPPPLVENSTIFLTLLPLVKNSPIFFVLSLSLSVCTQIMRRFIQMLCAVALRRCT